MNMTIDIWQLIGLAEWTVICLLTGIAVGVLAINFQRNKQK